MNEITVRDASVLVLVDCISGEVEDVFSVTEKVISLWFFGRKWAVGLNTDGDVSN
jgi:hypothetical protein